jgi:hypothetical protein
MRSVRPPPILRRLPCRSCVKGVGTAPNAQCHADLATRNTPTWQSSIFDTTAQNPQYALLEVVMGPLWLRSELRCECGSGGLGAAKRPVDHNVLNMNDSVAYRGIGCGCTTVRRLRPKPTAAKSFCVGSRAGSVMANCVPFACICICVLQPPPAGPRRSWAEHPGE